MKIATFNANSIRSRVPIVLEWLNKNQPDVLCIQETKAHDSDFPVEAFDNCGYEFVFKGEKRYNGVAMFSKHPISDVSYGLDDEPNDKSRLIAGTVDGIAIVNTYVPQGRDPESEIFQYKLNWYKRLKEYFNSRYKNTDNVIWLGDLNVAMDARDVHNAEKVWGSVCYCQEVIDAIKDVADWGFTDTFRKHCQDSEMYTFWDYRVPNGFKRNMGWRLDYIMATKPLADKCTRCWVDKEPRGLVKPSDHTFLIAEFDV